MLDEHLATIDYRQHDDQPDLEEEIQLIQHAARLPVDLIYFIELQRLLCPGDRTSHVATPLNYAFQN